MEKAWLSKENKTFKYTFIKNYRLLTESRVILGKQARHFI